LKVVFATMLENSWQLANVVWGQQELSCKEMGAVFNKPDAITVTYIWLPASTVSIGFFSQTVDVTSRVCVPGVGEGGGGEVEMVLILSSYYGFVPDEIA